MNELQYIRFHWQGVWGNRRQHSKFCSISIDPLILRMWLILQILCRMYRRQLLDRRCIHPLYLYQSSKSLCRGLIAFAH